MNSPSIITFSRRTDPAFHMDELMNWLRAGYASVPNPFSGKEYRVSLLPKDILLFTFWTKNPDALASYIPAIESLGIRTAFFITTNGYPFCVERNVPELDTVRQGVVRLYDICSADALWWRYDPVLFTGSIDEKWHIENFKRICGSVWAGHTCRVIFSLAHIDRHYSFARRNLERSLSLSGDFLDMPSIASPEYFGLYNRTISLFEEFALIAAEYGISADVCCSPKIIPHTSKVPQGSCLSRSYIEKIVPVPLSVKTKGTRKGEDSGYAECSCLESRDIGTYGTCDHGCVYCYAERQQRNTHQ
jgi:hypothetical protein